MEEQQHKTLQSAQANRDVALPKWVSPAAWTQNMMEALLKGRVKMGVWHSLIDKVWKRETLLEASSKVLRNKGNPGVDHVTCTMFKANEATELEKIEQGLKAGTYKPQRIKRVEIPKPGSREKRPLGIPTVRDRVVQAALKNVIEPIFENEFLDCSYGFRPKRGQKDALREVERLLLAGYCHVVDVDIRKFFDTIDHTILMTAIKQKIADGKVLELIESFLRAEVLAEEIKVPDEGTPQGGIISPLLANIYLHPLDKQLTGAGYKMVRYADDMVIMCKTQDEAISGKELLIKILKQLKLELNEEKTHIVDFHQGYVSVEFLGYRFYRNKEGKIRRLVSVKSEKKFKDNIRARTSRMSGISLELTIVRINSYLKGWMSYFKNCSPTVMKRKDEYIRKRLRTILRKQHKKKGQGGGFDYFRWRNKYFEDLGYQPLIKLHAQCRSASR